MLIYPMIYDSRSLVYVYGHVAELVSVFSHLVRLEYTIHHEFSDGTVECQSVGAGSGGQGVGVTIKRCHGGTSHTAGSSCVERDVVSLGRTQWGVKEGMLIVNDAGQM